MKTLDIKNPKFDKKNPRFGSGYASLSSVLDAVKAGLPEDAVLTQGVVQHADGAFVFRTAVTVGETHLSSDIPFVLGKDDPQGLGSALTYHRRYGLCTLFNIVGEEDDDGNAATPQTKKASTTKKSSGKAKKAEPKTSVATDEGDDW